jgi:hypothetical protein
MESEKKIKNKEGFNSKPFTIMYIIIFAFILVIDVIVIVSLFRGWAQLKTVEIFRTPLLFWMYLLFLGSPIVKVGFEIIEIIRFGRFLKSDSKDIEGAINIGRGFRGTRIFRVYYLILMIDFIVWMSIFFIIALVNIPIYHNPQDFELTGFLLSFEVLLYAHILSIIIGPGIIKFSADYKDRKKRNNLIANLIANIIIWVLVLIFLLNFDMIIFLFLL